MKRGIAKQKHKYNNKFIILYVYHLYLNYSITLISKIISRVSKNEGTCSTSKGDKKSSKK
jgi:hypothetical protein